MDLGATVCMPRAAQCDRCPLRGDCRAAAMLAAGELPAIAGVTRACV